MERLWKLVVPAYIFLCLLLGGSAAQGTWANAVLQLFAVLLIASAALCHKAAAQSGAGRQLLLLAAFTVGVILLHMLPLPPGVWTLMPGSDWLESGYAALGYAQPWRPLSVTPHQTLQAAYTLLSPLAVIAAILRLGTTNERMIAGAIVLGALANICLAVLQLGGGGRLEWTYLYSITNTGAVGFFANRNHMASLLVAAIPFSAALFVSRAAAVSAASKSLGIAGVGGGAFALLLIGLLLNSSMAAIALSIPTIAFSAFLLPVRTRWRNFLVPAAALAAAISVVMLASPVRSELLKSDAAIHSRAEIWDATTSLIARTVPVGTGIGSFPQVYASGENPRMVDRTYVNHAHNDYLELVLELGLPGLLLLLAFLVWWTRQVIRVWRTRSSSQFAKAATIASAAILAHSLVDYPLRMTAIAALFGACLALLLPSGQRRSRDQAHHVIIG
ncbi:MAG TPA: O-antigen ligase family protein [Bauldia sp.]|nr:O-antigen ligase family protein [Bauldia sp.]